MNQVYYRVIDYPLNNHIFNTDFDNYGVSFSSSLDHFIECYFKIANKMNIPVDFLISINNQLESLGNAYIEHILTPAIVNGLYIDVFKVTRNINHRDLIYPIALMNEFIQSLEKKNLFVPFSEGKYIWEAYLEYVRINIFAHYPSRKLSTFFFDSISNCRYYIKNHRNNFGKIYEVEFINTKSIFKGDMKFIDDLSVSATHLQGIEQMHKYWNGESTSSPIYEYVFQGEYSLKAV